MRMGRIGDGDVHAAYVEFRAKESDKVRFLNFFPSVRTLPIVILYNQPLLLSIPRHQLHPTIQTYSSNNTVSLGPMHLLPIRARKKHLPSASTPPRVSQLPQRHERAQP